jgi:hypothetical protein
MNKKTPREQFIWNTTVVIPSAILGIVVDVVTLLTWGYYSPNYRLKWLFWITRRKSRKARERFSV